MPSPAATDIPEAATYSHILAGLVAVAIVALVILAAGYLAACWLSPFTTCRHANPRRAWRCHHCQGTRKRLRAGRRLLNHIRATRRH